MSLREDVAAADIKVVEVSDGWYNLAQDRKAWTALCQDGLSSLVEQHHTGWHSGVSSACDSTFTCQCGRSFRRKGDLTRHRRFCGSADPQDH